MPETLARIFLQAVSYGKPNALLTKQGGRYRPISSRELYRRVARLHLDLRTVGIGKGDRCALLSENRWEWAVADFALMTAGIASVPLYPTLPAEQLHYLLEHSEARVVMVSNRLQLGKILDVWPRLPRLEGAVIFDPSPVEDDRVIPLASMIADERLSEEERRRFEAAIRAVRPEDLASIIYTSGTTGTPKGVMLTHGNLASNVVDCPLKIRPSDVALSFLPLCHVAERVADYVFFYNGATVAYAESIDAVPRNMQEVRPTVAFAVPRFFEKIHGKVIAAMSTAPPLRRKLFEWAVRTATKYARRRRESEPVPAGLAAAHYLADALVFRKLRKRLGGRFRLFVSGAAPLSEHLAEFFHGVGLPIYEAYGLTETSGALAMNTPEDVRLGTVGKPLHNAEVKIAADGEVLVKGPYVTAGYYRSPDQTAAAFREGWFLTGDIGRIDEHGCLSITDRKKDLFKTSGGKYIAPAPIENRLKTSAFVSMAVVVAEKRNFPSALIVPDFDKLRVWARDNEIEFRDNGELVADPRVKTLLKNEVDQAQLDLPRHEQVKRIHILDHEFSIENGEITPTMKVRRKAVEMRYSRQIDALYGM